MGCKLITGMPCLLKETMKLSMYYSLWIVPPCRWKESSSYRRKLIPEYPLFFISLIGSQNGEQVKRLLRIWSNRLPSVKGSLNLWDDIMMVRYDKCPSVWSISSGCNVNWVYINYWPVCIMDNLTLDVLLPFWLDPSV